MAPQMRQDGPKTPTENFERHECHKQEAQERLTKTARTKYTKQNYFDTHRFLFKYKHNTKSTQS